MGRRRKYETHVEPYLKDIAEWVSTMSEAQIAKALGIAMSSFELYKNEHPELRQALQEGKRTLVEELKDTLKKKARGFKYTEKKTTVKQQNGTHVITVETYERYSPPDTGAIHLLLKNLDDTWRNDDADTMKLKRDKLEMERQKAESENW